MRRFLTGALIVLLLACPRIAAAGADEDRQARNETNLRVNRKLLSQYSWEIGRLRRAQRDIFTQAVQERLTGLRYKIRALNQDRERLKSRQPMTAQADEFLASFLARHGDLVAQQKPNIIATPASETRRLHEEALKRVAERNLPEAAKRYEEIVIIDPNNDEAYLLLGHVYVMMGQYDRAGYAYYNAVHIDRQNYDEIIPFYQNMIVNSPNDDEAHRLLGYAYLIIGDAARAKDAYLEAVRINPANIEAQKGLALIRQRFGI
jgi:cytochrome c-type biogenesis protein CcmH/NrfG